MRRFCVALALITTVVSASLGAQTPAPPAAQGGQAGTPSATAPQAPARPPSLSGQAQVGGNIRLQLTITDTYGGTPQKKTVAIVLMSGQSGMIRTQNQVMVPGVTGWASVRLNVDAMATAYANGQISTRLTVNYMPVAAAREGAKSEAPPVNQQAPGVLEESIVVILTDGKPMVLSESADPATDRKVTLEATATILK